ncbi:MAG: hypothetical protein ABSG30_01635 [Steroidobacteraceae bacterium]|jgi:hypothetical protein
MQFSIGAGGALTDTGAIATTGSHYDAVNIVLNQSGAKVYAYVLSNAVGVDTNTGALWQYGVESSGELAAANPPMLNIGPVALAQVVQVDLLYVLTTNSGASANTASTGGNINFYSLGADGVATLTATTKISAPSPVSMGMLFLLAP